MLRFLVLLSFVLTALMPVQAATTTGPLTGTTVLAYKPTATIDTAGISRLNLPVLAGETAGMASVGSKATVGRLLGAAARGALGPWGMAAITAAQICYDQTDWKICHSTNDPVLPITIDKSRIVVAETETIPATTSYSSWLGPNSSPYSSPDEACSAFLIQRISTNCTGCTVGSNSVSYVSDSKYNCTGTWYTATHSLRYQTDVALAVASYSCLAGYFLSDSSGNANSAGQFCTPTAPKCPENHILTNDLGGPLPVSGEFCTPLDAYSCPADYRRTDAYQNSDSQGMFCSYNAPYLTEQQKNDILAPYLLNYYANQLFSDKDGKTLPDIFSDADTTFDPTVTPADMPMTWTDLKKYTDWITSGKGQTTNPLAPYYISPSDYKYTQTIINNTNNTNTNTDTTTNVNPTTTASSAAMTQAQFEQSTSKADKAAADAINATDTTSMDNLTKTSGFDGANDQLTNISNGNIGDLPSLPTPNLPGYSSCQTIDLSWKDHPAVFPSQSQCLKMEEAKKAFGYILYLLTFLGLVWELLRRVE